MTDAIQHRWYNREKTILYVQFSRGWVWADVYDTLDALYQMQETVNHGVHIIYDLSLAPSVPSYSMPNLGRLINEEHPNDRLVLFVTTQTMLSKLFDVAVKMYNRRTHKLDYHFVRTIDDALDRIDTWELSERHKEVGPHPDADATQPLRPIDDDTQPLPGSDAPCTSC